MNTKIPESLFKQKLVEILSEKDIRFAGFVKIEVVLIEGQYREDIVPFENDVDK